MLESSVELSSVLPLAEPLLALAVAAPLAGYRPYFSLADKKYAGSAALVSRKLKPLSVRYTLDSTHGGGEAGAGPEHDPEGRVLLLEFDHWQLLAQRF